MERKELIYLKKRLQEEIEKRDRLKELLNEDMIQEFITLMNLKSNKFKLRENDELLKNILKNFVTTKTNEIYVCTGAYYLRSVTCRGHSDDCEAVYLPMDSKSIENKEYCDIESGNEIIGYLNKDDMPHWQDDDIVYAPKFEQENIVLNPYNTFKNNNGYEEVRQEFFENAIKYGQAKSKKLLLSKYPRL